MKPLQFLITICLVLCITYTKALQPPIAAQSLDARQQHIVTISAFTANGDVQQLRTALNDGLDAGLSVNEIKEIIVQLYAYAGFPRSLNALNTFMAVLKERQQKGIKDEPGKLPAPLPAGKTKLEFGTGIQTKLVGIPVRGEVYEFAPAIDQFLKEHLFGDIFGRDNLDWKTRELATISALAGLGKAENQLRSHFGVGMRNGLTAPQLENLVSIIAERVGTQEGDSARAVLNRVLNRNANPERATSSAAPGTERTANTTMTGTVYVKPMAPADSAFNTQVASVSFEPGARTYWHSHHAGQILIVMEGTGLYQEKGKPVRMIRKGDVIKCPPNTAHWHGAGPTTQMTHMAVTGNTAGGRVVWMQEVTEQEYNSLQQ